MSSVTFSCDDPGLEDWYDGDPKTLSGLLFCTFEIVVDEQLWFGEEFFCLLEFIHHYLKWKRNETTDMLCFMEDADENPLISFVQKDNDFVLFSPWQRSACQHSFTKEQLVQACDGLCRSAKGRVHEKLGIDIGSFYYNNVLIHMSL